MCEKRSQEGGLSGADRMLSPFPRARVWRQFVVCGVDQSTTVATVKSRAKILTGRRGSQNTIQNNDKRKAAACMVICGLRR